MTHRHPRVTLYHMRALIKSCHNWHYCAMKRFIGLIWEQFYFEKKNRMNCPCCILGKKSITIHKLTVSMLCFLCPRFQILTAPSLTKQYASYLSSLVPSSSDLWLFWISYRSKLNLFPRRHRKLRTNLQY